MKSIHEALSVPAVQCFLLWLNEKRKGEVGNLPKGAQRMISLEEMFHLTYSTFRGYVGNIISDYHYRYKVTSKDILQLFINHFFFSHHLCTKVYEESYVVIYWLLRLGLPTLRQTIVAKYLRWKMEFKQTFYRNTCCKAAAKLITFLNNH